jgi:glycosyltransferase involved in cell wall biosynthesis
MTRLLHILETADPRSGGPVEGARRFGEAWASFGHRQDILTLDPPDEIYLQDYPGEIYRVGPRRGRSLQLRYRYSAAMIPWLRAHAANYDAVIVSGLWRYHARGAFKALAMSSTPYFVYTHGMLDPWFRRRYPLKHAIKQISWLFTEGPLLRHANKVLFTTREEQILADRQFFPYCASGAVVGFGTADVVGDRSTQIAMFRAAFPKIGQRRFLLFLSRIHPKKGCDLLIDAFATIASKYTDLDLVIAGPDQIGIAGKLRTQAGRLGLDGRVHFPGMLSGDIKAGAFQAADAFVLTSHQENFGVVVAEAMSYGSPVLISDKVNIWREVDADSAGLVESDTVDGACALLERFLALSPVERREMGYRARHSFVSRFQVTNAASALMAVIEGELTR